MLWKGHLFGVPLAIPIVIMTLLTGCGERAGGTRVLYEAKDGTRLPEQAVARIATYNLRNSGIRMAVTFDSSASIGILDTLEILPGPHRLAFYQVGSQLSRPTSGPVVATSVYQACLRFDFNALAGHLYELKLIEFSFNNWKMDLVDVNLPHLTVHGVSCPPIRERTILDRR